MKNTHKKMRRFLVQAICISALLLGLSDFAMARGLSEIEAAVWSKQDDNLNQLSLDISRFIQLNPYSAKAHYLLSLLSLRELENNPSNQNLLRQATQMAQQAMDLQPTKDYGYVAFAQIYINLSEPEKALALIKSASAKLKKPSWRMPFVEVLASLQLSNSEGNIKKLGLVMDDKNSIKKVVTPYVIALLQSQYQDDEQKLLQEINKWNKKHPNPLFQEYKAAKLASMGQPKESHRIYGSLMKSHPDFWEAQLNDAVLLGTKLGQGKVAIKKIDAILLKFKDKVDQHTVGIVHLHKVHINIIMQDFESAKKNAIIAAENIEDVDAVIAFLNKRYHENRSVAQLIETLEYLNENYKGSAQTFATIAEIQSRELNHNLDALDSYLNALTLDPKRSDLYNGMGLVYYRMNDIHNALKLFATATEIDPADALAKYNSACMLARLGESEQAIRQLTQAISLDPSLQDTAAKDGDFSSVMHLQAFQKVINAPTDLKMAH